VSQDQYTKKAADIQAFVAENEGLAKATGAVKRESKMTGQLLALTMLLGILKNPKASLEDLALTAFKLGVEISEQGLSQRVQNAADFFGALFQRALEQFRNDTQLDVALLKQFSAIYVLDSTQIELWDGLATMWRGSGGMASKAALKLHLMLDYLTGSVTAVDLTAGTSADTRFTYPTIVTGALYLQDMGYFQFGVFSRIMDAQAYFVSRLKPNVVLFSDPDTRIDLYLFLNAILGDCFETDVLVGVDDQIPLRTLFFRVPPSVAAERRRKAKANAKKKKRTLSKAYLTGLDWTIYITNLPPTMASSQQIHLLYRIRWQIELVFKLLKSQLALDQAGNYSAATLQCRLYARLTLFVLLTFLTADVRFDGEREASWVKAFHVFKSYADDLLSLVHPHWAELPRLLATLQRAFRRFALKTRRRSCPSTLDLIRLSSP